MPPKVVDRETRINPKRVGNEQDCCILRPDCYSAWLQAYVRGVPKGKLVMLDLYAGEPAFLIP